MKSYLNTLNEREKWMLIGGVLCLFIYVYYLFLYAPLSNKVTQKATQLVEKTNTLAWMQKAKQQGHAASPVWIAGSARPRLPSAPWRG